MSLPPYADLLGLSVDPDERKRADHAVREGVLGRPGFLHGGDLRADGDGGDRRGAPGAGRGRRRPDQADQRLTVDFMRGGRDKPTRAQGRGDPPPPPSALASPMSRRPPGRTTATS